MQDGRFDQRLSRQNEKNLIRTSAAIDRRSPHFSKLRISDLLIAIP
jgi:hypothetical protein